jgi:hypothetical protein
VKIHNCMDLGCEFVCMKDKIWIMVIMTVIQRLLMFNSTFNNIPVISWRSALLVEETRRKPTTCRKSLTNCIYERDSNSQSQCSYALIAQRVVNPTTTWKRQRRRLIINGRSAYMCHGIHDVREEYEKQ